MKKSTPSQDASAALTIMQIMTLARPDENESCEDVGVAGPSQMEGGVIQDDRLSQCSEWNNPLPALLSPVPSLNDAGPSRLSMKRRCSDSDDEFTTRPPSVKQLTKKQAPIKAKVSKRGSAKCSGLQKFKDGVRKYSPYAMPTARAASNRRQRNVVPDTAIVVESLAPVAAKPIDGNYRRPSVASAEPIPTSSKVEGGKRVGKSNPSSSSIPDIAFASSINRELKEIMDKVGREVERSRPSYDELSQLQLEYDELLRQASKVKERMEELEKLNANREAQYQRNLTMFKFHEGVYKEHCDKYLK